MAVNLVPLQGVLSQLEAADIPIVVSSLLPAIFAEANQFLPAAYQSGAAAIEADLMPALQSGLGSLLAKLVPAAPATPAS